MAKKKSKKTKPKAKKIAVQKKIVKKKIGTKKKAASRKKASKKTKKKAPTIQLPAETVGRVTHYFPKVRAAAVLIERDSIRAGDTLYFKGHTTRFKQQVESLQVNHQAVPQGNAGDEVGIRVRSRVREHDQVFKL